MFFTVEKIQKHLGDVRAAIQRETIDIPCFCYKEGDQPDAERVDFDNSGWDEFSIGSEWGGRDVTAWFRTQIMIPQPWRSQKVVLRFQVGPRDGGGSTAESLLYVNGKPLQGLDVWHEEAWLPPEEMQSGLVQVAIKAWGGVIDTPQRRRFSQARIIRIDQTAEQLYYSLDTILKTVQTLPEEDFRRVQMVQALDNAYRRIDFLKPRSEWFYQSLRQALDTLDVEMAQLDGHHQPGPVVVGVGHAHIDVAWLWRVSHSREKVSRTFSTALHLMRQYPGYHYMHSTPQLYQYLKEDYPDLYRRVKEQVSGGRWEPTGGMWVEADVNMPSGESLVRQFLYGKRFFQQEFEVDNKVLWLPDVFGYSPALPQIAKKSGIQYFLTSKISWNQYNRFPYDTFHWRGIDGTELLTTFVTTPSDNGRFTYNGMLEPKDVKGMWDQYRQKEVNHELLQLFGWGDGGGGPTKEMLEAGQRMKSMPGLPRVEFGSAEPYFERLGKRLENKRLPVWDGELYLEYHRGTYTSQAYNKYANRRSEFLFHDAEWLNSLAGILLPGNSYPKTQLRRGWELILLNQFHDVLTGSSIHEVYEDSTQDYETIRQIGEEAVHSAQNSVIEHIGLEKDSLVAFNSLGFDRDGLFDLPGSPALDGKTVLDEQGQPLPVQVNRAGEHQRILLEATNVPGLGYQSYPLVDAQAEEIPNELVVTPARLENRYYRIQLNERGQMISLFDKRAGREILADGQRGNVLQVFEDKPLDCDAWDIDIYYLDKMREVSDLVEATVEETGPVRGVLKLRWRLFDSEIIQRVTIYRTSRRIDFVTTADWHEHQALLKVAFPVDIRATHATYDIQFGALERPNNWNTSWDAARFEVFAHKWADLSEGDYGVSLMNDCKYGYDVKDNVLRLTLIKSGVYPDPMADQGSHKFTYSLLPHEGDWRTGRVIQEAYSLNEPVFGSIQAAQKGDLPQQFQLAQLSADHIMVETIKKAEEGDAWVVRLYETQQRRKKAARLTFALPIRKALECNLIEESEGPANVQGCALEFAIGPYEIKTFLVWF